MEIRKESTGCKCHYDGDLPYPPSSPWHRYLSIAILLFTIVSLLWLAFSQASGQVQRERPKAKPPNDDTVYLWNQPQYGFQTIVSLNSHPDSITVDVGILVPMTIKIEDVEVVQGKEVEAAKKFNEIVTGKLLTADLNGKDQNGITKCDLWDGASRGWVREQLIKSGFWVTTKKVEPKAGPKVGPPVELKK